MADRTPLQLATLVHHHLTALEALEAEVMRVVEEHGEGPTNAMKGFFHQIEAAHTVANRAAKQIPEVEPQFGGK